MNREASLKPLHHRESLPVGPGELVRPAALVVARGANLFAGVGVRYVVAGDAVRCERARTA